MGATTKLPKLQYKRKGYWAYGCRNRFWTVGQNISERRFGVEIRYLLLVKVFAHGDSSNQDWEMII